MKNCISVLNWQLCGIMLKNAYQMLFETFHRSVTIKIQKAVLEVILRDCLERNVYNQVEDITYRPIALPPIEALDSSAHDTFSNVSLWSLLAMSSFNQELSATCNPISHFVVLIAEAPHASSPSPRPHHGPSDGILILLIKFKNRFLLGHGLEVERKEMAPVMELPKEARFVYRY